MTLPARLTFLSSLNLTYGEKTRSFKGEKGSIDQDVVEYGSDELFSKMVKKLKKYGR